jgi:uncharacterized membrane protein HdeD (DUF308 family)
MQERTFSLSPGAPHGLEAGRHRSTPRRIAALRALAALVWAAALVLAVGDDVPTTASDVPVVAAALLTAYPLIDVTASLAEAAGAAARDAAILRVNAALSALAAVALAAATFGGDAAATLVAFGAWAVVSGAVQLGVALSRRRAGERQLPLIVSGALSAVAGLSFAAASGQDDAHLAQLAGYATLGAVLYLVWAMRAHRRARD